MAENKSDKSDKAAVEATDEALVVEPVVESTVESAPATFVPPVEAIAPPAAEPVAPAPAAPATAAAAAAAAGPHYMSIVAFALGLAGVLSPGLPSIAAIVLGHIGLAKEPTGRTFAIIGLVAGYLVTGMFVIGMIILFSIWGVVLSSILTAVPWESLPRR